MSAIVALALLAAAGWFVMNLAGGPATARREPMESVADFSRAMRALDPQGRPLPPGPAAGAGQALAPPSPARGR